MKIRTISSLLLILLIIPIFIKGGILLDVGIVFVSLVALREFLHSKENEKKLPLFIKLVSYIMMLVLLVTSLINKDSFTLNYTCMAALFSTILLPTVLYHDKEKYSINDAFYLIGGILFLTISMLLLSSIRQEGLALIIYLLSITVVTDTFALFTGLLIGKTKLLEEISPKKTWEGSIGGAIMGTILPSYLYISVINSEINILLILVITLFLSILGQLGDLVFSAIKRYYNLKDFSNLLPGHGGILDRLDSIIFVMLGYMLIVSIL